MSGLKSYDGRRWTRTMFMSGKQKTEPFFWMLEHLCLFFGKKESRRGTLSVNDVNWIKGDPLAAVCSMTNQLPDEISPLPDLDLM